MGNCRRCRRPDARRTTVHRCASGKTTPDICGVCAVEHEVICSTPGNYAKSPPRVFVLHGGGGVGDEQWGWLTPDEVEQEALLGAITLFLFRSHDRCHRCFGVSFASGGCSGLCPRLLLGRAVHHGPLHGRGRSGDGDRLATLGRLVCWVDSAALFCLWALLPVGRHLRPALRARPSCSPHLGGDGTGLSGAAAYMQRCMYSW
jgi:hypothetical protein